MWKPQTINLAKSYIIRQWILIMSVSSNRTKYQNKPQTAYADRNPSVVNCSICVPACLPVSGLSELPFLSLFNLCSSLIFCLLTAKSYQPWVAFTLSCLFGAVPSLLISLHFISPNCFMVFHDKNVSWLCEFLWRKFGTKNICKGILVPSE